jgi:arylsulfatase A-like enzyme
MKQIKRQIFRTNPFATALVVGLGWGLAFGFIDGLPILLELPILPHLPVRLQALTYLMVWYGLVATTFLELLGLITWGALRLLQLRSGEVSREIERHSLVALYSGAFVGLLNLVSGLRSMNIVTLTSLSDPSRAASALVLLGLGSVTGLAVGLGVYGGVSWWQNGRGYLRPLRWNTARTGVLGVFSIGVLVLSALAGYRRLVRGLDIFQPSPSGQTATPGQPNIVLITSDSLRADHLGIYGYDPEISPNIDALAARGVVFEQAMAQSSWTAPSMASFVTSLHPTELGIHFQRDLAADLRIDEMRVTLAEALHDAGYRTQAYTTNGHIVTANGYHQGFDNFADVRLRPLSFDLLKLHQHTLAWLACEAPKKILRTDSVCRLFDWGYDQLFDPPLLLEKKNGPQITAQARDFLRQQGDGRFFLWLYYLDPHIPYNPQQPFRPFPAEVTPDREKFLRSLTFLELSGEDIIRPVDLQGLLSLYDGEIAEVDALVGEVLAELEKLGLQDRTLVVFLSDHGEEFYDHEDFTHGHTMYDELLHVPLVISGPGIEAAGQSVETQVRLLDLVPTLCEIAGAHTPGEARGRSLMPFLRGEEMDELPAFSETLHTSIFEKKSVRYNGYKLIYDVERERVELYDVRQDPREQVNLAESKPEIVGAMLPDLKTWIVQSAQTATELPRQHPLTHSLDDEMRQRLRDAGY